MFRPVLCVFLRDFFVAAVLSLLLPDAHCRDGAVQKTTPANPTASRPASGPFYPDIFIGRCLCVTAIESGPPFLKDYQREAGWEIRAGIAYSPRISTEKELFYKHDPVTGGPPQYLFEGSHAVEAPGRRLVIYDKQDRSPILERGDHVDPVVTLLI